MKLFSSLPVLAIAGALCASPMVAAAQTANAASAPVSGMYTALGSSSGSSSSSAAELFETKAAGAAAPAMATEGGSGKPLSGLAVGVKFGLAGVGFDVATPLVPRRLNLRGGASFFSYSPDITTSDNLVVNGTLKFQNAAVMADFFPFKGRFRISGGATVYNFTNLAATITVPGGNSFTLGNTKYYSNPSSPLVGTGVFNFGGKTAGRVSIGTGNMLPRKGHWTFESEIGVQFFTEPTVAFAFTGQGCTTDVGGVYSGCGPVASSDVASEQAKIQNDLTDLKYFPILSIGLSYKIH